MTTFTWLHLSDLHLRDMKAETSLDRGHLEGLLKDIAERREKEKLNLDAVFFTGDVAYSGKAEEYVLAATWFDKILDACGLSGQRDRLFIVPGNHDVDRGVVKRTPLALSQHEDFAKRLLDSDSCEKIDEFLSSDLEREWAFTKFHAFAQFTGDFFLDKERQFDHNRYYSVRAVHKEDHTVAVLGLNSAWLSFKDNEQGQLLLGEKQLCDALEEAQKKWPDACLRIVLVHHPLYWLAEKDIHRVQQHLPGNCNVLLQGHLHLSSFSIQSTPDSYLHVFAAGAISKAKHHAYNFVRLNLETRKGTAIVRLQLDDIGKNWGADTLTYRNAGKGKIRFSLASSK